MACGGIGVDTIASMRYLISAAERAEHLRWLLELTQIPTATGREWRVEAWIESWARQRPDVRLERDGAGNITLSVPFSERSVGGEARADDRPVYFTAHLDHPAFVVERVVGPHELELSFRGGVMRDYFTDARVRVLDRWDRWRRAAVRPLTQDGAPDPRSPFPLYLAQLEPGDAAEFAPGDVGVWDLPGSEEIDGLVHTPACDDLAAAAAALAALDVLRGVTPRADVRVLFTRAEEVGFIGAIAAVAGPAPTIPRAARVLALENSRSFPESPIGGGPIVRVGDRLSVFSPSLTDAVAKRAEQIAGGPAQPTASQKLNDLPAWKWQRKLMSGGACEASVFCHAGYEATCLCLPLGNYHNMADLAAVQAGTNTTPARIEREFIARADFEGLVDLLVACGQGMEATSAHGAVFERLWREKSFVLR